MERSVGARGPASASESVLTLAPRFQNMIGVLCRLLAILQRNWCRLSLCSMACSQHSSTLSLDMDGSVYALIDTQVMERSVGARGAASASESVLTGAAISEYDRCALQMPGNSATQLVSLCSMACSQHSSTLSLDMAWLCGGHELKQMRCRVVVLLDWVGNEWG